MKMIEIKNKPTAKYKFISFFVAQMPRLKIYRSKRRMKTYLLNIQKKKIAIENFKEDSEFHCEHKILTIAGMKTFVLNPNGKSCILYLHGGAFINRPIKFHMNFAADIALQTDSKVFVPYYPLAPQSNVFEAVESLKKFAAEISDKFVLLGDSAGGGLLFSFYYSILQTKIFDQISCAVAISPWLDLASQYEEKDRMLNRGVVKQISNFWQGDKVASHPVCSPCFAVFDKPIEALIIVGGKEILKKDCDIFLQKNSKQNITYIEYTNLEHDFPLYPVPERKDCINKIMDYIKLKNLN